jgi:homocitrate synthase NifV
MITETGRVITTGEYGGIKGFRHVYDRLGVHFKTDKEARNILELVQYATIHTQESLTDDELWFIAKYPDVARKVMTVNP